MNDGNLTEEETGIKISEIGTLKFLERLISMIARREDFGDILDEGLQKAGQKMESKVPMHLIQDRVGVGGISGSDYNIFFYCMPWILVNQSE